MLDPQFFPFPVKQHISLKKYSTFRIGGPALFFKELTSIEEAQKVFSFLYQTSFPFFILGRGSNCLFDDDGFQGLVLYNKIQEKLFINDQLIRVGSGNSFSRLGQYLSLNHFSGLEFACGIPGSVGGAVYMNAGIGSMDTYSVLESVEVITAAGKIHSYKAKDLNYGYRTSPFQEHQEFITAAVFRIVRSSQAAQNMHNLLQKRLKSQPYMYPSAGCVFKNPSVQLSAGRLIDQAGLKGLSCGGAQISEQHGNFIINTNNATAADVRNLIHNVQAQLQIVNVQLEEELIIVPAGQPTPLVLL